MSPSLFETLELAPRDPILGLNESFNADKRTTKVNLGVGVYFDDAGRIPLLKAVREAEMLRLNALPPRGYLPIDGIAAYNQAAQHLLFGSHSEIVSDSRAVTIQALGGTGALKLGADFLKRIEPDAQAFISDPSWENHRALFETAGFTVNTYPYYDPATHGLRFEAMLAAVAQMPKRSILVLHACCHNPTGVDLSKAQWTELIAAVVERDLVPFMDIAYQGFGDGIEEDAFAVRQVADAQIDFLVSSSFSKSFSLYGERVGALTIAASNKDEASRVLSQAKRTVRTNYSNPPTHGASVVSTVLGTPALRVLWEEELASMRDRIRLMRTGLTERLNIKTGRDFSFIERQRGMFSYSGLTEVQVERLKNEFGIFAVGTGRICVAALNSKNIDYVADAVATVIR